MQGREVAEGIYRFSAEAMSDILFESIWPLPDGISMNSYLIKGDRSALIDGVCGWDGVPGTLIDRLSSMGVRPESIDTVVLNHLEPDHTGWLDDFRKVNENFTIYTSEKGAELAQAFYGLSDSIRTVKNGDTLDLGNGKILRFLEIPNVHWPETIATYEESTGTLMPCDAFGSFGAITGSPFDDELPEAGLAFFEKEALRYYSNILGAQSVFVTRAIRKLRSLDIRIVAPAHGIVWRKNPGRILDLYETFASWSTEPTNPEITVIWGSMYGNTEKALHPLLEGIAEEGIRVHVHRVPQTHSSFILESAYRSSGLVLGMPTYEYRMFPPMAEAIEELGRKKVQNRSVFRFGSFGWSGGAQKDLLEIHERFRLQWQFLDPVEFRGRPTEQDCDLLRKRGKELAMRVGGK